MALTRTGIIILILLVIAVATSWLKRGAPGLTISGLQTSQAADFFLEDFQMQQFDEQGVLSYRMAGQRLEHYPKVGNSKINKPDMSIHPETESPWRIESELAVILPEANDEMRFTGQVYIRRPKTAVVKPISLRTEHLLLKPRAEIMQSEATVVIVSQGARIQGSQLFADLKHGQMTLHEVKSEYVP